MESYFSLLKRRAEDATSLLCVGLDPHPKDLPKHSAAAALDFCRRLVDETSQYAAAFKPNAAFFEIHGAEGWSALKTLIDHIRESSKAKGSRIPVLLDAKRGDIASTAAAYADAIFNGLGADAVTINPYLGADSVTPFLSDHERGVFLLCKTSNPGAADLQDLAAGPDGAPLYEQVAHLAEKLNENDNVGLVVGATQLEALRRVRAAAPELWFLAPGVGAQGGDLDAAMAAGLRSDGLGMLVPVSRSIARAENPRSAAAELRDAIAGAQLAVRRGQGAVTPGRGRPGFETGMQEGSQAGSGSGMPVPGQGGPASGRGGSEGAPAAAGQVDRIRKSSTLSALADGLVDLGCVQFGRFTLKSGIESPFYIDLRRLVADPQLLARAAEALVDVLDGLDFHHVAALPYAALPIGTAVSLQAGRPLIYPRKETKEYGTKSVVEGLFEKGETTVVLDDLITTGGSKFEGIDKLVDVGLVVRDVVVLIDRSGQSAEAELAARGVDLHAVFTLHELLDYWEGEGQRVSSEDVAAARAFLAA